MIYGTHRVDGLRRIAESDHRQYRQYDGYWDGWTLGRAKRTIKTKLGVAAEAGELVLTNPQTEMTPGIRNGVCVDIEMRTFYSVKNRCNTGVKVSDIELLEVR